MSGIYTTCVSESTIDESPMAYKNPVDILSQINDTAEVVEKLTPVFSFKAPSQALQFLKDDFATYFRELSVAN